MADLNDAALAKHERLESVAADVEHTCVNLASKRETLERELLDWKNMLVQKVEGCYTQVLGQLLAAFGTLENEALLNREYISNMLWSSQQLSKTAIDALNSPDLDTLELLRNRLNKKISQIDAIHEEDLIIRDETEDWRYMRPNIGDDDIWMLIGHFDMGSTLSDSTMVTPVTTPCHDNDFFSKVIHQDGAPNMNVTKPKNLPVVSFADAVDTIDENLNIEQPMNKGGANSPSAPQLIASFQTKTKTDTSRCHPVSLAVSAKGDIIVPDKHNKKIKIFDSEGELVREISNENLHSPTYVAMTPDKDIAVCDRKAGDIKVFSTEGELLFTVPKLFKSPAGIAFTSSGDLLVGDTGRKAVHVVSIQAATIKSTIRHFNSPIPGTGCKEEETTQIQWPHCVSVSSDDVMIVSDRSSDVIQMLDLSGRALGRYGSTGAGVKGRFQGPYGTVVRDNGEVYVCDYGNHCLHVLSPGGQWREPLLTAEHGLQYPSSVQWLGSNRLAVSEYYSGLVKIYQLPDQRYGRHIERPPSPVY